MAAPSVLLVCTEVVAQTAARRGLLWSRHKGRTGEPGPRLRKRPIWAFSRPAFAELRATPAPRDGRLCATHNPPGLRHSLHHKEQSALPIVTAARRPALAPDRFSASNRAARPSATSRWREPRLSNPGFMAARACRTASASRLPLSGWGSARREHRRRHRGSYAPGPAASLPSRRLFLCVPALATRRPVASGLGGPRIWRQAGSLGFRRSGLLWCSCGTQLRRGQRFRTCSQSMRVAALEVGRSTLLLPVRWTRKLSSRRLARSAAMEAWKSTWYEAIGKSAVNVQQAARVAQFPSSSANVNNRWP